MDHNQIWSAGIYLSSYTCKPFWIPYLPYFRCLRENMQNFAYFQHVFLPLRTWRIVPYDLSLQCSACKQTEIFGPNHAPLSCRRRVRTSLLFPLTSSPGFWLAIPSSNHRPSSGPCLALLSLNDTLLTNLMCTFLPLPDALHLARLMYCLFVKDFAKDDQLDGLLPFLVALLQFYSSYMLCCNVMEK